MGSLISLSQLTGLACGRAAQTNAVTAPTGISQSDDDNQPDTLSAVADSTETQPPTNLDASSDDDGLDADIAAITKSLSNETNPTETAAEAASAPQPELKREPIVYRVSPKGLTVEVDGLHLRPSVRATRHKNGTFSLDISVRAESFDGRIYWIQQASEGPLSIAGSVKTSTGKKTRFSDHRQNSEIREVGESESVVFSQRWPGKGQPKLWQGQTLKLEIGLWGVRAEAERERPVRRLFTVEMMAKKGVRPTISPPALDWGR